MQPGAQLEARRRDIRDGRPLEAIWIAAAAGIATLHARAAASVALPQIRRRHALRASSLRRSSAGRSVIRQREETLMTRAGVTGDDVMVSLHSALACDRCDATPDRVMRFAGSLELCVGCVQLLAYYAREVRS
jgi:hypothetical protein